MDPAAAGGNLFAEIFLRQEARERKAAETSAAPPPAVSGSRRSRTGACGAGSPCRSRGKPAPADEITDARLRDGLPPGPAT